MSDPSSAAIFVGVGHWLHDSLRPERQNRKKVKHDRSRSNRTDCVLDLKIELRAALYRTICGFCSSAVLGRPVFVFHKFDSDGPG
ncbi:MAG: hypothetical protein ABI150_08100, partial [Nitrobacter sp.]